MNASPITPVQGYQYDSMDDDHPRNFTICKILKRADVSDTELREYGPAFTVEFGDGEIKTVYACELNPWYATE